MADEVITAKSLVIVDSEGRPRIVLSVDETDGDSDCQIEFKDIKGNVRYMILVADDGTVNQMITDADGSSRTTVLSRSGEGGS